MSTPLTTKQLEEAKKAEELILKAMDHLDRAGFRYIADRLSGLKAHLCTTISDHEEKAS
jgi:hypothetical protein